ncbi:uncharacterized protein RJT21DRAFT_121797 [Scheffersomyces amazonensis]|uniref:uncharacterized protein n=1 Tax=Scheffersomyces amazonensis TaxID=1078765 RepID=UPI00315D5028
MKYDMPIQLRISLARVYYAICLSRGQHINLKVYVRVFELLTKDRHFLKTNGLLLDWNDLCQEFINLFHPLEPSATRFELKNTKQLIILSSRASYFFEPQALPQIYTKLGAHFTLADSSLVLSAFSLLPQNFTPNGINDPLDIRHYISSLYYMWKKLGKSTSFEEQVTSRLGHFALSSLRFLNDNPQSHEYLKLEKFGIFTEDQMQFVINTLLNSLGIMIEKYASNKCKYFHGFASMLVFSMFGDSSGSSSTIMNYLKTLLNAVESYVHPSNSGDWSKPIALFTSSLIRQFHSRYNVENEPFGMLNQIPTRYKLSQSMIDEFVEMFLPIVNTGIQSKNNEIVEEYIGALQHLAHLNPTKVLDYVLLDIYESLQGVISTHRVYTAIQEIDVLARYIVATPIYRVHVPKLLVMILPGFDTNDLEKTLLALNCISAYASVVPFADLTDGQGDPTFAWTFIQDHLQYLSHRQYEKDSSETFVVDSETELQALKSASAAFTTISKTLSQRIIELLENLTDPKQSDGAEAEISDVLPKLLYVLSESLSDTIFTSFRNDFFDFIFNNQVHAIANIAADICGALIKRDPKPFKKYARHLIERIKQEIEDNGAGKVRTGEEVVPRDQGLHWNLVILNECVANANGSVVEIGDELTELSFYLMDNVRGPTTFVSSYLLHVILQSSTTIRLKESRLISPAYITKYGLDEKCWGAFQFDKDRFHRDNLTFDWFIPQESHVQFAVETFNDHTTRILEHIQTLIKEFNPHVHEDANTSVKRTDELRVYLYYLGYALSGVSGLLDPSFEEYIPKLNHQTESIQQRLILLKKIREMDGHKEEVDPENINENLQRIIENLSNDDLFTYMLDGDKLNELVGSDEDTSTSTSTNNNNKDIPLESVDSLGKAHTDDHSFNMMREHMFMNKSESLAPSVDESLRATPQIEGIDMSSMNPAITFRERKLYTSNYYFGDDMELRKADPLYLKLHKIYRLIGKSLHILSKFLVNHYPDNPKLFKHFLLVMNIWFADVGRERLLGDTVSCISYGYISLLQEISGIRKPFTRVAIGARIEKYHNIRVALHATSRTQTDLDKVLIEDATKLAASTYTAISRSAQSLLVDVIKRVNGSYTTIIKSAFKHLSRALDKANTLQIKGALNVFSLRKIKNKLSNDSYNIQRYVELLHRCLEVDNVEVYNTTQQLFKGVYKNITPPSNICLINHNLIDTIRPPDEFIDLEIKAVTLAKDHKRQVIMNKIEELQSAVMIHESTNSHWRTTSINLALLINLQMDPLIPTNYEFFQLLAKVAANDHPVLSRLALKGISNMINKLNLLDGLNYDVAKGYTFDFLYKGYKYIDTQSSIDGGQSYTETYRQELANTTNPTYFIDRKDSPGWLFWGDTLKVLMNVPIYQMTLNENDETTVTAFGNCITRPWVLNIIKLWINDNDVNISFQVTDVYFINDLVHLISSGYTPSFNFEDLLSIVTEIYVSDDKSTHIVVCEIITGILLGSKFINPSLIRRRDEFISTFLNNLFNHDLSPDTKYIWYTFSWWIPSHIDIRRFPIIMQQITDIKLDIHSDFSFQESTQLSFIRSLVTTVNTNLTTDDCERLIQLCLNNINHRYQAVRSQIGALLAVLSLVNYDESVANSQLFIQNCNNHQNLKFYVLDNHMNTIIPQVFNQLKAWRSAILTLTPQQIIKSDYFYGSTTVLTWMKQILSTSSSIIFQPYVVDYILPFVLELIDLKEVCQLGNVDPTGLLRKLGQIHYTIDYLPSIIIAINQYSHNKSFKVHTVLLMGLFTETVYFKNFFKFTNEQRNQMFDITYQRLFNEHNEIREAGSKTFAGLIHMSPPVEAEQLINNYNHQFVIQLDTIRKKKQKKNKTTTTNRYSNEDLIKLHGITLGLGALIHAFSFSSPPPSWVPQILTILANKCCGIEGIVGRTAKETLSKFKKDRQDTWHIDSKVFSEEQMQDLEGVLWRSYFI